MLSLSAFNSVGFVPYYVDGTLPKSAGIPFSRVAQPFPGRVALADLPQLGSDQDQEEEVQARAFVPQRIVSSAIGLDLPVLNPDSTVVAVLDEALKSGAVRYPGSALGAGKGTTFIFGHSSRLPVVHNQMYKAFNNLSDFSEGDIVKLEGEGYVAMYRVLSVRRTDANEEIIDLSEREKPRLILATCDTFGAKSARWVVEAEFVASYQME